MYVSFSHYNLAYIAVPVWWPIYINFLCWRLCQRKTTGISVHDKNNPRPSFLTKKRHKTGIHVLYDQISIHFCSHHQQTAKTADLTISTTKRKTLLFMTRKHGRHFYEWQSNRQLLLFFSAKLPAITVIDNKTGRHYFYPNKKGKKYC